MADRRLIKSRKLVHETLEVLNQYSQELEDIEPAHQIQVRLETLESLWNKFVEIEMDMSEETPSTMQEFSDLYFETKAKMIDVLDKSRKPQSHASEHASASSAHNEALSQLFHQQKTFLEGLSEHSATILNATVNHDGPNSNNAVKLPKINIEPFRGNYEAWPSFIDLFTSTVHENKCLSNVHKFQILRSLLRDGPSDMVKDLLITDANYGSALEKLKNRYAKKKVILSTLISSFLDQPAATNGQAKAIRRISDLSDEILKGITSLGAHAETRDPWLLHIVLQKLDPDTQEDWSKETVNVEFPTIDDLLQFLNKRCDAKESCELLNRKKHSKPPAVKSYHTKSSSSQGHCPHCNNPHHQLFRCIKFKRLNIDARRNMAQQYNVCFNCLRLGHDASCCTTDYTCRHCHQKHHSLLHLNPTSQPQPSISTQQWSVNPSSQNNPVVSSQISPVSEIKSHPTHKSFNITTNFESNKIARINNTKDNELQCLNAIATLQTLLPTAIVRVRDASGQLQFARILIDSASMASFVSEPFLRRLGIRKQHNHQSVSLRGIGNTSSGSSKGIVSLNLQSQFNPDHQINISALVLNKITSLIPSEEVIIKNREHLSSLDLADSSFCSPGKIDILLGAEKSLHILTGQKVQINPDIVALSTIFGFVIGGQSNSHAQNATISNTAISTSEDFNSTLQLFWNLEEVPKPASVSNLDSETHFRSNVTCNSNGRYVVKLPFHENHASLGNSRKAAFSRLFAMERKFKKDINFKREYTNFMEEYISLGHMSIVPPTEIYCLDSECFYLPHHAVVKSDSTTTKLRVVFDGSCKSSSGLSLNDILHVGPTIQPDLVTTLLRFRRHTFALTADIEKMYRQVLVHDDDKRFQRIVWRSDDSRPIEHYQLNTVTYGTSCAPYLATRALQMVADDNPQLPSIATASQIKSEFYVDDLLTGSNDLHHAKQMMLTLTSTLEKHGFRLRKWRSNSEKLLNVLPNNLIECESLLFSETDVFQSAKTLGLHWNPQRDIFIFKINIPDEILMTKRKLLSQISRTFDPLGWLSPITITMKSIMQQLWLDKSCWDEELCQDVLNKWIKLKQSLFHLEKIEIPRHIFPSSIYTSQEIHAFCDASRIGYAAVLYIRCLDADGVAHVRLLIAKNKVAPLKPITIPKLELSGAVTLANLVQYARKSLEFENLPVTAWCDSQIVLAWLSSNPSRWEQFVANRCGKILETLPRCNWRYIKSKDNPADHASRGINPSDLVNNANWWSGPHWLKEDPSNWPTIPSLPISSESEATIKKSTHISCYSVTTNALNSTLDELFQYYESFYKITKLISSIVYNITPNKYKTTNTVEMLRHAENICIKYAQQQSFSKEISCIKKGVALPRDSNLASLTPYLDENCILRVRGRLKNSLLERDAKNPIILSNKHVISTLIIRDTHHKYLHAGPTLMTNILRQKFWILNCKNLARHFVNKCTICTRQNAASRTQLMGDIPSKRVTPSRPFQYTGVDFAGPIYLKARLGRGKVQTTKGYIALFICWSTKAVHIELVSALTTDAYIAALRRFISRRGIPSEIQSDNGSNFIGAKNELHNLYNLCISQKHYKLISTFLSQNEIRFGFIPPRSPHFGGLWEANIKSIKYHLNRVCNTTLVFEEMATLLAQIEAILNSRPIVPISSDIDDLDALTPGHFLIGAPLTSIPEPNLEHLSENRLSRWQNIQARVQSFWRRWSVEYLHTLQQRHKWQNIEINYKVDDLVLIKEDNLAPTHWLLGRIMKLHPGTDQLVRVATIKTKSGELVRPIVKLCPLLIDDQKVNQHASEISTN